MISKYNYQLPVNHCIPKSRRDHRGLGGISTRLKLSSRTTDGIRTKQPNRFKNSVGDSPLYYICTFDYPVIAISCELCIWLDSKVATHRTCHFPSVSSTVVFVRINRIRAVLSSHYGLLQCATIGWFTQLLLQHINVMYEQLYCMQ